MAPSPSPTCAQCLAIAQDRDHLRIYEFLMRLRPEFEAVRAQLLHRVTPPSASDTLAYVLAEETRLQSLDVVPPPAAPYPILAAPQQLSAPSTAPLLSSQGLSAPVHPFSQSPGQGSSVPHRRSVRCHYCHALGHVRTDCRKLQRAQQTAQQRIVTTPPSASPTGPLSAEQFQQLLQQFSRSQISVFRP
ncbi:Zinc finger CCHC-type protein [Dioscorea alata]|uniref:Zinc finger CCHC-type protein n=1 Tax=Dioscorea alata TaxID=55571 RepID=A0ACB7WPZ8_DIOAL|nr:Zinc finger CCHC-type protein [Dioscorea alata]